MKRTRQIARGIGKVILALFTGVLMPILIWVALGAALNQKLRERKLQRAPAPTIGEILARAGLTIQEEATAGRPVVAKTFVQQPVSEIRELLSGAGLTIHDEAVPRHCWEVLHCPQERQETCPAHVRRDVPCWVAIGLGKGGRITEVCVNCTVLDLKGLPLRA